MFRFRQFTIEDDRCGHHVGTDGVLLGAWARVEEARRILDVGTGSGLIALMAAQRAPQARVLGLDIDEESVRQAGENARRSPFSEKVEMHLCDVRDFYDSEGFDCILCNPPFFTEDTLSPDAQRARSRHASLLGFGELITAVRRLLVKDGMFYVILPFVSENIFVNQCFMNGLYVVRRCLVRTVPHKAPRRALLTFALHGVVTSDAEQIVLQERDGSRSDAYARLTKDFYL